MSRIVSVELRKSFDTRSGFWLMASIGILAVIATGADDPVRARRRARPTSTFAAAIGFPMAVILPMVAILSVTSEWSQRTGLTSFTLVPHRGRVILAKACVAGRRRRRLDAARRRDRRARQRARHRHHRRRHGLERHASLEFGYIILANMLGMLVGFMLGVLIRNSRRRDRRLLRLQLRCCRRSPTVLAETQEWFARQAAVGGLQLRPGRALRRRHERRAVGPARP